MPSEPAVPQVDDSLIEEWERTKRAELQVRRDEAAKKKSVAMQAGKKAIEEVLASPERPSTPTIIDTDFEVFAGATA